MLIILNDKSKFQKLGPSSSHDRTSIVEDSLNDFLNNLKTNGELSKELHDSLRSTGGTRPRMYGLPKVHKAGVPLRPILSMIGSPQYDTSKWLCKLLEPVRKKVQPTLHQGQFCVYRTPEEEEHRFKGFYVLV